MVMEKIRSFKDLHVWKRSHELALLVYKLTKSFPPEERFGLVSQMRRAAVSVAANIAEGFKKKSKKDKIHFYNIAQSSLEELRYYFILVFDLRYMADIKEPELMMEEIARMLSGLINRIATELISA